MCICTYIVYIGTPSTTQSPDIVKIFKKVFNLTTIYSDCPCRNTSKYIYFSISYFNLDPPMTQKPDSQNRPFFNPVPTLNGHNST